MLFAESVVVSTGVTPSCCFGKFFVSMLELPTALNPTNTLQMKMCPWFAFPAALGFPTPPKFVYS